MKVKIGNKITDSYNEPIMIIFEQEEKELIGSLDGQDLRFCSFPENSNIQIIERFMTETDDPNQLSMDISEGVVKINPLAVGD